MRDTPLCALNPIQLSQKCAYVVQLKYHYVGLHSLLSITVNCSLEQHPNLHMAAMHSNPTDAQQQ